MLFRGDAAFARPELYEYLEQEKMTYAIRLPANQVIQEQIQPLLERPHEWPSRGPIVSYHDFAYQAQSWHLPRRVVAKVEWHQGELFPRVGFIVTNLSYPPKGIVRFYNGRGTAEQWIKEGKYALNWTRLSCHKFVANQVRLWLFVLAYNLGNFLRRLVALDTTNILGRGAVKDTYNLLTDGIVKLLRALAAVEQAPVREWAKAREYERYLVNPLTEPGPA